MRTKSLSSRVNFTLVCVAFVLAVSVQAATIYQGSGSSFVAFQGESVASIVPGSPTSWVVTNDVTANGGKALYQAGANQTASASSFALYSLNFSQAGTYTLYYR